MPVRSLPPIPSVGQKEKSPHVVYTIVECQSCHAKVKRAFAAGDYVTKEEGTCDACKGPRRISLIYSETVSKQR